MESKKEKNNSFDIFKSFPSWKITEKEMENQIKNYSILGVSRSYHKLSALIFFLIFSFSTVITVSVNILSFTQALPALLFYFVISIFAYKGNKWAIILIMIIFTLEMTFKIVDSSMLKISPFLWWFLIMPTFYKAYIVENEYVKIKKSANQNAVNTSVPISEQASIVNDKIVKKKSPIVFVVLSVLFLLFLFLIKDFSYNEQKNFTIVNKTSPELFIKNVYSSKTCNEFLSYFNGEIKVEFESEMIKSFGDDVESCNENISEMSTEAKNMTCVKISIEDAKLDYRFSNYVKNNYSSISDIVSCRVEQKNEETFFLNYNNETGDYKIINMGDLIVRKYKEENN